jgi:hypothetical protein
VAADQNLEILPVEKDSTKIALIWLAITLYAMEGFLRVEKSRVDGSRLNRVEEERKVVRSTMLLYVVQAPL